MGDEVLRTWTAEAEGYDDAPDHGLHDPRVRAAWTSLLRDAVDAPAGHGLRIVEMGAGTATLTDVLADAGHRLTALELVPAMLAQARTKTARHGARVGLVEGDAQDPRLAGPFDVVVCRHVLWALPDPPLALRRWCGLLGDGGRLVLVEGSWSTGAGLRSDQVVAMVRELGLDPRLVPLSERPALWGGPVEDERYLVTADVPGGVASRLRRT